MQLASPHRENFWLKEDRSVIGGAGRPGSRRGLPPGVTVFANAMNKVIYQHNPASHQECKNTCHRESAATAHTAER